MVRGLHLSAGLVLALSLAAGATAARAMEFNLQGYADFRTVAPPRETSWVNGGLSKFRYGGGSSFRFAEAVAQGDLTLLDDLDVVAVVRAEPDQRSVVDALEAYAYWHPASSLDLGDSGQIGFSVKAGAFFPTISLENDDLGWASPYTLTSSAINTWIGEELRTLGGEATLRWRTPGMGTVSLIGSLYCCNDPTGILMADRGWSMNDRPTGLFERVRLPDATLRIFRLTPPGRTGEFDEIDGAIGWYAGLNWIIPDIGKLTVLRYDNDGDPAAKTLRDTAWDTRFWSGGFRTQIDSLILIAQAMRGQTIVIPRPGTISDTKFQSAFLLASYDYDVWRLSAREDLFATRHMTPTPPHAMSEDGDAFTVALSWAGYDWLRLTGEVVAMNSRRLEYLSAGFPAGTVPQAQYQFSARFFY